MSRSRRNVLWYRLTNSFGNDLIEMERLKWSGCVSERSKNAKYKETRQLIPYQSKQRV